MISLKWRPFNVSLKHFKKWQDQTFGERSDGFATTGVGISVFIHDETIEDAHTVAAEWSSLTEEGEALKLAEPDYLANAIVAGKQAVLEKDWGQMTIAERKLVVGLPLNESDKNWLIQTYG